MASTYLDEFVLNFDLNHLNAEENVQTIDQKYAKIRRTTSWLKSKIISTDFAIQKYQAKKDDYENSVKAHTLTREELKQACINYKDASEKCSILENENKIILSNQEVLKKSLTDMENKYDALLSHTNQLQMLVKQLENEKDALTVEKELGKCDNKDSSKEIILLKKEKDVLFKDIVALKDVILGKKKANKKHIKIVKKYVKEVKSKGPKILCTSEESSDDMDNYCDIPCTGKNPNELHNNTDKNLISSIEQNFIDNYSDGEVSVDTGRGSSRANSHDKYLSSPDRVETHIKPNEDVIKQVDAANNPIMIYPPRSVATSPIIFDLIAPLSDHQCNDYTDCVEDVEYIIDDIPLSEEIDDLVERENLSDCASPVPDLSKLIDSGTRSIEHYKYIILKESDIRSSDKSLFFDAIDPDETNDFDQDSIPKYMCETSDATVINDKVILIDACTSPLPTSDCHRTFVDIGISTDEHFENVNLDKSKVDIGTNTIYQIECVNQLARNCESCNKNITLTKNIFIDDSTSTDLIPPEKRKDIGMNVLFKNQNDKSKISQFIEQKQLSAISKQMSESKLRNDTINSTEELNTHEKVCLESNSSKNLHFESTNDEEVQNILKVMKLRQDLISPISKTPYDFDYLKLIPEMNSTLIKIWTAISNVYKMPDQLRSNDINPTEINIMDKNSKPDKSYCDQQQVRIVTAPNQVIEHDVIDTYTYIDTHKSVSTGQTCLESSNMSITEISNLNKSNTAKLDIFTNELLPYSRTNTENSTDLNKICEGDITNTNKTDEKQLTVEYNNKEKKSLQQCKLNCCELNKVCEDNFEGTTNTNTSGTCNIREAPTGHTIIINGTKTKKKSKLEKFKDKLLPACKIKKITPPIMKHPPKTFIKHKSTAALTTLNQKMAYEKAVKVMTELRSNQDLEDKKKAIKTGDVDQGSKSCKIKSLLSNTVELNMLSTRSRTSRLSEKEEVATITANFEQNIRDIEKSPGKRKLRKRPADTQVDILQSNCKRILRSSNVSEVTNENALPEIRNFYVVEHLHNEFEKNSSQDSASKYCKPNNNDQGDNPEYNNCSSQNEQDEVAESNMKFEKGITKRTKPVIELSKCLADNANVVSITPGSIGYLDVNKNINHPKNSSEFNSLTIGDQNSHLKRNKLNLEKNDVEIVMESAMKYSNTETIIKQGIKVVNTCKDKVRQVLMRAKDSNSTTINESSNYDQHNKNIYQNSSRCTEQILHVQNNGIGNTKDNIIETTEYRLREQANLGMQNPVVQLIPLTNDILFSNNKMVSYSDLDLYTEGSNADKMTNEPQVHSTHQIENILCTALDRYGVISVKYTAKKIPDTVTLKISQKIEESITKIITSPKIEQKSKMNDLVNSIQNYKIKHILAGLMKYLKDPTRKTELFNKIVNGPAPPMTKSEVILLYVIERLNGSLSPGFIDRLWNYMEHALFQLNRAPDFDVIESMSHFYAVLCRYFRNKSRLRCFMLDAMYCLQFKAVPLIRQCLDVCPGVLPNAHEHMAKTSLVTCLVYLLHFYKCQDRYNRAQDIRNILYKKYHYRFSEWNESMILEIFRKAIMDLRGTQNDKKMLRVALIILCKRHGAKWCQLNIIQNILLPIIEKKDVPERIKQFCVLMLGPLMKPFPADRKAQCEIVINKLLQMLKQNNSQEMKEAIYSSLIFMSKHDQDRVVQALLSWNPEKVSLEFEEILNDYVMEKPLAVWKKLVSRKPSQCT